ncbi:MAG: HEAT repeat domain-containing protein, partial [Acidobacteria bacterium]|nr:HEAT repeat domain-containing protein [Acidobacteriota bacterium]
MWSAADTAARRMCPALPSSNVRSIGIGGTTARLPRKLRVIGGTRMSQAAALAGDIHAALVPFLLANSLALGALFGYLLASRAADELAARYRQRLIVRYRPLIEVLLTDPALGDAIARLEQSPRHHRRVIASLLLAPLDVATGTLVDRVQAAARVLGLIDLWTRDLGSRHWWIRADSARALGLVDDHAALGGLIAALDDSHDEVRAAAVEALGMLGGQRAIAALVARLSDESRHQRARVVDALRKLGEPVTSELIAYARAHLGEAADSIEVLGLVGGPAAVDDLIAWCSDWRPSIRASALQALGSIGLDDRSYYYALRGLADDHAEVRAMAARALGRSRRADAVPYLSEHLNDEWQVAAHAAEALRALGTPGLQAGVIHKTDATALRLEPVLVRIALPQRLELVIPQGYMRL